jgi:acylglycerol lipase
MSSVHFLDRPDEPSLAWWLDPPEGAARGKVLLIHGYADHAARFEHVARVWNEHGLVVGRFDLRGHGLSDGARGYIAKVSDYVSDAQAVLAALDEDPEWSSVPGKPAIFGHSLGGLVASKLAIAMGDKVAGLACTSPFFGLKNNVPFIQLAAAKVARKVFPRWRQRSGLSGRDMTHDTEVARRYDKDPLRFGHVTAGFIVAALDAQTEMLDRARDFAGPLYCIVAGDDRIVSNAATERFFERAGSRDKELVVRPGLFHELLNEPDWREHASQLAERMVRWSAGEEGRA